MADKNQVVGRVGRVKREQRNTQIVMYTAAAIIGVIVILLITGVILEGFVRPSQPVAVVNGEEISTRDFQERVRLERYLLVNQYVQNYNYLLQFGAQSQELAAQFQSQMRLLEIQLDPTTIGRATLDQMIEEALIRQQAAEMGIVITEEQVSRAIEENFSYFPNGVPEPTITPTTGATSTFSPTQLALVTITPLASDTPDVTATSEESEATPEGDAEATPADDADEEAVEPTATIVDLPTATIAPSPTPVSTEEFGEFLNEQLGLIYDDIKIDEQTLYDFFAAALYSEALFNIVTVDVPAEQEQVWARHILVEDEETAGEVLELLAEGEDWTNLAAEFSQDPSNAQSGGDLGWFDNSTMVREFTQVAFNTNVGSISEVFQTSFGWHIIQVLGHENRPLSSQEHLQYRLEEYQVWLDALKAQSDITEMDYWAARTPDTPNIPPQISTTQLQQQP